MQKQHSHQSTLSQADSPPRHVWHRDPRWTNDEYSRAQGVRACKRAEIARYRTRHRDRLIVMYHRDFRWGYTAIFKHLRRTQDRDRWCSRSMVRHVIARPRKLWNRAWIHHPGFPTEGGGNVPVKRGSAGHESARSICGSPCLTEHELAVVDDVCVRGPKLPPPTWREQHLRARP